MIEGNRYSQQLKPRTISLPLTPHFSPCTLYRHCLKPPPLLLKFPLVITAVTVSCSVTADRTGSAKDSLSVHPLFFQIFIWNQEYTSSKQNGHNIWSKNVNVNLNWRYEFKWLNCKIESHYTLILGVTMKRRLLSDPEPFHLCDDCRCFRCLWYHRRLQSHLVLFPQKGFSFVAVQRVRDTDYYDIFGDALLRF